jgi:hypothetical protein
MLNLGGLPTGPARPESPNCCRCAAALRACGALRGSNQVSTELAFTAHNAGARV